MKRLHFHKMPQLAFFPTVGIVWKYKSKCNSIYKYGLNFMWLNFLIVIHFGKKRKQKPVDRNPLADFYHQQLLENARDELFFQKEEFLKPRNSGATVEFRKYTPLGQEDHK